MDKKVIYRRLNKLEKELVNIERHTSVSLKDYLRDEDLQALIERRLQLAAQISIDIDCLPSLSNQSQRFQKIC
ncbi:MAG: hypothetical protein AB1393_11505 [Candidatus Edwardsbacteria bacterium]